MRISRSGAHKNRGENILVYSSDPSINIYGDKSRFLLLSSTTKIHKIHTITQLSCLLRNLRRFLQKINEEYLKNPSNIERKIESHTKTLLQLLIISSGLLNNKDKEETS